MIISSYEPNSEVTGIGKKPLVIGDEWRPLTHTSALMVAGNWTRPALIDQRGTLNKKNKQARNELFSSQPQSTGVWEGGGVGVALC